MTIMIQVNFDSNFNYCIVPGLWQWDYGQILQISGTNIKKDIEVHFSLFERGGESIVLIGVYDDNKNVLNTHIPGHLLAHKINRDYNIYAFIYFNSGSEGETVYKIVLPIKARPKPIDYDDKEDDAFNATLAEAVQQVNDAKESARTYADDALESANRSSKLAEEIESQVTIAVSSAESATNSATQADESEANAKESELEAKRYAELAEQEASKAGWIFADVNDADGHLYITTVGDLEEELSFTINEAIGSLEVGYE